MCFYQPSTLVSCCQESTLWPCCGIPSRRSSVPLRAAIRYVCGRFLTEIGLHTLSRLGAGRDRHDHAPGAATFGAWLAIVAVPRPTARTAEMLARRRGIGRNLVARVHRPRFRVARRATRCGPFALIPFVMHHPLALPLAHTINAGSDVARMAPLSVTTVRATGLRQPSLPVYEARRWRLHFLLHL